MKKITPSIAALILVAISLTHLSFGISPGGDGYEIYLDNKLVTQQFGPDPKAAILDLGRTSGQSKILIRYYHCGKPGTSRRIKITDDAGTRSTILSFPDNEQSKGMEISVATLLRLYSKGNIYYSSTAKPAFTIISSFTK